MIVFEIGERKHIYVDIFSKKNESFEITKAGYELIKKPERIAEERSVEESGECVVNEHTLDMLISPRFTGEYVLKITYYIADEILVENIAIRVVRYE